MSNTREYRSEIRKYYRDKDKDTGGLLNMVKGVNVLNRGLKSGKTARHGWNYASNYTGLSLDEYAERAPSWLQKLYSNVELDKAFSQYSHTALKEGGGQFIGDMKEIALPTESAEAMEAIGSQAPGAPTSSGLANNPYALGALAIAGIGYGIGKEGTTFNRWNKKVKGWFK